jgi:hypothetical protein
MDALNRKRLQSLNYSFPELFENSTIEWKFVKKLVIKNLMLPKQLIKISHKIQNQQLLSS